MEIKTPRGEIVTFTDANGTIQTAIVWRDNLQADLNAEYAGGGRLQKFIDSEYIRSSQPYVPFRTGILTASATLGTVIGSGTVKFIAPYARRQFYSGRKAGESQTGALRGRLWHDRWKADNLTTFMQAIENIRGK